MSSISGVDQVLSQIRAIRQQTDTPASLAVNGLARPEAGRAPGEVTSAQTSFDSLLQASVQAVNDTQQKASSMATAWERGDSEISLTQVMVSLQKADVSFKAMMEVRNKMVDAYQEVMRMSI